MLLKLMLKMGFPNLLELKLNYCKEKYYYPTLFFKEVDRKKQDLFIKHKIRIWKYLFNFIISDKAEQTTVIKFTL